MRASFIDRIVKALQKDGGIYERRSTEGQGNAAFSADPIA